MNRTKLYLLTFLLACICSCSGQVEPQETDYTVVISSRVQSTSDGTKVVFGEVEGGKYPSLWSANDTQMKVSLNLRTPVDGTVTPAADGKTATAVAKFSPVVASDFTFHGFCPCSAYTSFADGKWYYSIPATQTPLASSPDEKSVAVAGVSETYAAKPSQISMPFSHVNAYGRITFTNLELQGASVSAVELTAAHDICGSWTYDAATGTCASVNASKALTLSTTRTSDIWFGCAPAAVGGTQLKICVKTSSGNLEKTVTLPSGCNFTAGHVQALTVDMTGIHYKRTACKGWFELPAQKDDNHDGIDDSNKDLYYSWTIRADVATMRNFSSCYSKGKIHPVWVAAPMHSCYTGSAKRSEAYQDDPAIHCEQSAKFTGYTRGHMVGSADRNVSTPTNKQAFYHSNIGAQTQTGFNTGGGAWNNLESRVDALVCSDTLYQVIGCFFETWTDKYGYTVNKATGTNGAGHTFQIPTAWYKVLLRTKKGNTGKRVDQCKADELQCAAFILTHRGNAGHKPSSNDLYSVEYVEQITGLEFFVNVPNAPKSSFTVSDWL